MRYFSEVALCFTNNGHEQFLAELAKQDTEIIDNFMKIKQNAKLLEVDGSSFYYWSKIEWYNRFLSIQFITSFLESLPAQMTQDDYLFIRVGESDIDIIKIGEFHNNPFNINLNRIIKYTTV